MTEDAHVPAEGSLPAASVAALQARLHDLQVARAELPPHSAQGWHADLDDQVDRVRRRLATARRAPD